jgi:hypothetical protein
MSYYIAIETRNKGFRGVWKDSAVDSNTQEGSRFGRSQGKMKCGLPCERVA